MTGEVEQTLRWAAERESIAWRRKSYSKASVEAQWWGGEREDLLSGRKMEYLVPRPCRFLVEDVGMH
jgi:hypothetical protein